MAGKSSRFYNEGYTLPKFMLPLGRNSNVFRESVKSFENYFKKDSFLFINRSDDNSKEFITKECEFLGIKKFDIVTVDFDTKGQADTVQIGLKMVENLNTNEPIYIFNIDSIRVHFKKPENTFLNKAVGFLEVFKGTGEHWSFIESGDNETVIRTTEKIRISNLCSNGLYYFSSVKLFFQTFRTFENINTNKELFIAPMYNILIRNNEKVKYKIVKPTETIFSGTPSEYLSLVDQIEKNNTI